MPPQPGYEYYEGEGPFGGEWSSLRSVVLSTRAYENPHDSHDAMGKIQDRLADAGLAHIEAFNRIYRQLTGRILRALDGSDESGITFDDPEAVRRTIGIFADQYFRQLRFYVRGEHDLVDAPWQWLFYSDEAKTAPPGMQFLAGMGAHIIYDLPWALDISKVDEGYHEDYKKTIGMLIDITAADLAPDYIPGPVFLRDFSKDTMLKMIAMWRERAWQDGKELQLASTLPTVYMYGNRVQRIKGEVTDRSVASALVSLRIGRYALDFLAWMGWIEKLAKELAEELDDDLAA